MRREKAKKVLKATLEQARCGLPGLTEKQCRTNKIAAAPLSLEAWVR